MHTNAIGNGSETCIIVSYAEYCGQYNTEDKKQDGSLRQAFKHGRFNTVEYHINVLAQKHRNNL